MNELNVSLRHGLVDVFQGETVAPYMPPHFSSPQMTTACTFILLKNGQDVSPHSILDMHARSIRGPPELSARSGFRTRNFIGEPGQTIASSVIFVPVTSSRTT
ncbi:hypothetical protein PgNI_05877 [Pyricularia grisea]|uniref:Uncharacterized protein n=1 Tax=Pyricularia grisea TaxID=148305 RepID=A0A6P8B5V4_PYRGI|nr:hypothetical protein PgNI_05877 [Pyricularia grisea]TLD10726.1 hypothetical protein PgNI_05877 [Pyricularia grisea]